MKNVPNLQNLGKEISRDFLESNISLNDSLSKVASTHGLNKNELHRVAEAANVESYLGLLKVSEDKYINFDLADASKIHKKIEKTASAEKENGGSEDDYQDIDKNPEFSFALYPDVNLEEEKIANTELDVYNKKYWLESALNIVENEASEKLAELADTNTNIYNITKQHLLQEVPFSEIGNFIKLSGFVTDTYINNLVEDLKEEFPFENFEIEEIEKTAEHLNDDSKLYNEFHELSKLGSYIQRLQNAYNKTYDDLKLLTSEYNLPLVKESGIFRATGQFIKEVGKAGGKATKETGKLIAKYPKTTVAAGIGGAGLAAGNYVGQRKEKNKKNVLTRENANEKLRNVKI